MGPGGLAERIAVVRERLDELRRPGDQPSRAHVDAVLAEVRASLDELEDLSDALDAQNDDLVRAAEHIDEKRRRYEDLFELAPDGYVVTDPDGRVLEANRAALDMLAVSPDAVAGLPIVVFLDSDGRRRLYDVLDRTTRGDVLPAWQTVIEPRRGRPFAASLR